MVMNRPALDRVFHALADPTRRRILDRLTAAERPVGELVSLFRISQPAVTKHLGVLERSGLIRRRKRGRQRLCSARPEALDAAAAWIARWRQFWNQRLDALEELLADERRPGGEQP
jgi:DNA-binding transcriptional ArsR family regulator